MTEKLLENFGKIYTAIYMLEDVGVNMDYDKEVDDFDNMMKNNPAFNKAVCKVAEKRGDLFTSDREAAAIYLAFKAYANRIELD